MNPSYRGQEWEILSHVTALDKDWPTMERQAVPGGWLYRSIAYYLHGVDYDDPGMYIKVAAMTMAFVPDAGAAPTTERTP